MDDTRTTPLSVRLPNKLAKQIRLKAKRSLRSVNSEIIVAVTAHVGGGAQVEDNASAAATEKELTK